MINECPTVVVSLGKNYSVISTCKFGYNFLIFLLLLSWSLSTGMKKKIAFALNRIKIVLPSLLLLLKKLSTTLMPG